MKKQNNQCDVMSGKGHSFEKRSLEKISWMETLVAEETEGSVKSG